MINEIADRRKVKNANSHKLTSLSTIEIKMMIVLISIQANKNVSKAIDFFIVCVVCLCCCLMVQCYNGYSYHYKHFLAPFLES